MRRALSSIEAYVWSGGRTTFHFAVCIRLRGSLDPQALHAALTKTQQRHPFLRSRVHVADGQPPYVEVDDTLAPSLRVVQGTADDDWVREVERELATPMDWQTQSLVRFVLIHAADRSDLIVTVHHGIADGMSAYYVLRDVLAFLAHPDREVEPLPLRTNIELLLLSGETQLNVESPTNAASDGPPPPSAGPFYAPMMYGPRPDIRVLTRALNPTQTAALVDRCRVEGATVQGAICAAMLQAHVALDGTGHTERLLSVPINRRPQFIPPVGEDVGTYFDLIATPVSSELERPFWDIAREVTIRLRELAQQPGFFQSMMPLMGHLYQSLPYSEFMHVLDQNPPTDYDISVTNLGRLDFEDHYGGLQVESVWGPAVLFLDDEKTLGVATAGGMLTMALTLNPTVSLDLPTANAMMDYTVDRLTNLEG